MSQGPTVTNKICVGTGKPRQNWQTSEHERSQTGNPQNIRQTGVSEQGKQMFGLRENKHGDYGQILFFTRL